MHFVLTRKLKFLLQRGHQITAKFIYPLSLQSTGPQLSVHPWKPTTTTEGEEGMGTFGVAFTTP